MRWLTLCAGITVALAVGTATPSIAQTAGSYEVAKDQAAAARQAMTQGQWDEAQARLARAIRRCEPEAEGRPCRLLLHYNLGYLYARWAEALPERRDGLLARSADYYRRVLAEAPDHAETVNNLALVLRDQGKVDKLTALRDRIMARNPALAARAAAVIGDGHAERGAWKAAYQAYADAAKLDPSAEAPRQKLLEAYRQPGAGDTADLLARLRGWEARFPEAAADGYRIVVQSGAERAGKLNERALLRWIALTSAQRAISSALVKRQLGDLKKASIDSFIRFLRTVEAITLARAPNLLKGLHDYSGAQCLGASGWWLETSHRRNALAEAALALGRAAVVAQDAERAEASFVISALCGPPSEEYMFGELRDQPFVFLDTMTELAWLQFRYPARDPYRKKLDAVVQVLFKGKGAGYQANDPRAIERHHVVLGQI